MKRKALIALLLAAVALTAYAGRTLTPVTVWTRTCDNPRPAGWCGAEAEVWLQARGTGQKELLLQLPRLERGTYRVRIVVEKR
jgi:hypothetical protein